MFAEKLGVLPLDQIYQIQLFCLVSYLIRYILTLKPRVQTLIGVQRFFPSGLFNLKKYYEYLIVLMGF